MTKRDKVYIALVLIILLVVAPLLEGKFHNDDVKAQHRTQQLVPNGSSDGRYHTCNFITEDGVTEHLESYKVRCHPPQDVQVCWLQREEQDPTQADRYCGSTEERIIAERHNPLFLRSE
jgi:hypothetical protein